MDNWFSAVFQGIAAVLGALILIGAAWALVRGSFNQARVKGLREDLSDADRRLSATEHELELSREREVTLNAKVDHQQTEIRILTASLTQKAEVGALGQTMIDMLEELRHHHQEAKDHWASQNAMMLAITEGKK